MSNSSFSESRITSVGTATSTQQPIYELWILRLLVNGGAWPYVDIEDSDFDFPTEGLLAPAAILVENYHKLAAKAEAAAKKMKPVDRPKEGGSAIGDKLSYFRACGVTGPGTITKIPAELREALSAAENWFKDNAGFTEPVTGNLKRIKKLFDLSDEAALALIFVLSTTSRRNNLLYWVLDRFDCSSGYAFIAALCACATGISPEESERLFLEPDSPLRRLLTFSNADGHSFARQVDDWFQFDKTTGVTPIILSAPISEENLQSAFFKEAPETALTLNDFSHLEQVETTVLPYLKTAVEQQRPGVNILIYGAPGSGKTELTRVLSKTLNCRTYEIAVDTERHSRLDAWRIANTCLRAQKHNLLVLDEAEDVFNEDIQLSRSGKPVRSNKAKINKFLETNACPTLWLTNSLENMDPAMLRRFDIILESAAPTEPQRRAIIEKSVGDVFSSSLKARLAATPKLTPGVITRVKSVVESLALPTELRDKRGLELINDVLRVQRAGTVAPAAPMTDAVYSTEYVNTDTDLTALADGLKHHPSARICLYGVPGTGKSAYAAWLAKTLGKPLLKKKASDLLDCYVGGTEARIAAAFAEATRKDAVLLIDEADSFLQDRSRSEHSWETTQVNEMLTQMESFEGVFIATTNLIDTLDAASLRRFDLKARFDYLRPEQNLDLFRRWAEKLGVAVTDTAASRVARLDALAPGDYAAVVRQTQFRPIASTDDLAERLAVECRMKDINRGRSSAIGFA